MPRYCPAVTRFEIDPDGSRVWVDATSSIHPIHSETSGLQGFFEASLTRRGLDLAAPVQGRLELAVGRLSSGNPLYDREMRRRVDARRFPTISGELTGIEQAERGAYTVRGDVTFRGVTRSYLDRLDVTLVDRRTLRLAGSHVFDVRDFGFQPPRILTLRVHPDVAVRVEIVARA